MSRKAKLAAFRAEVESGAPPYNMPREVTEIMHRATAELTASGAAIAFLAMMAAVAHDWPVMFGWLGLALFIDGIDGPLARRFRS